MKNMFKPIRISKKTLRGNAGYDNGRENIDPHIKTKVVSTQEGSIERAPTADNHITNKKYVDNKFPVTHASTTGQTADDHHNESHDIASHSDTTATGAELNTLTDNSVANTLHRHSELVASDGSPDPSLSVDADGNVDVVGDINIGSVKYYKIGGEDMFWGDTDYQVRVGYKAGEYVGANAGGTVENNIFIGGGRYLGRYSVGDVARNLSFGSEFTAFYAGYQTSSTTDNMFFGPEAGVNMGRNTTGQLVRCLIAGAGAASYVGYNIVDGNIGDIMLFGSQAFASGGYTNDLSSILAFSATGSYAAFRLGRSLSAGKTISYIEISGDRAAYELGESATESIQYLAINGPRSCYEMGAEMTSGGVQDIATLGYKTGYQWGKSDGATIKKLLLLGSNAGTWGTGSNYMIMTMYAGTDFADHLSKAIMYGRFNTTTASQELYIHAVTQIGDSTNYAEFKSDGELNLHGTARVRSHVRVGAHSWKAGSTAPAEDFIGILPVFCFDKTTDDSIHYSLICPYRMVAGSTINVKVDWTYQGAQDNGTVDWGLEYINLTTGETVDGATTTIHKETDGSHTTGKLIRTTLSTGIIGAVAHDVIGLRLFRDSSEDSLDTDACGIQVHFEFLMDKLGEAT